VHRLIGVRMVWWGLPMIVPCAARAEEDGGGGMWVECSELGSGTGGVERSDEGSAIARARERVKAPGWSVHGGKEVAAGEGSGSSWRARAKPGGKRKRNGRGRRRRVEKFSAGGGARGAASATSGGGRSNAEREAARPRGRRSNEVSEGLVRDFQRVQGPVCKLKFPSDTKS
jgi:hypothetical protein